jgi:hypothetical protein
VERSNLSSERQALHWRSAAIVLLLSVIYAAPAQALNIIAVYRAACKRDIGVILLVEKRQIHLLQADGVIKRIPRHEIVSLVYYPAAHFPLMKLPGPHSVSPIRVRTRDERTVVDLAVGWPTNFSERKISLLLPSGEDFTVDKESIWSLDYEHFDPKHTTTSKAQLPQLEHPQTSGFCTTATQPTARQRLFPQQILNDQVVIRRELDRLMRSYEDLREDIDDQKFYAVPQLYHNRTSLGFWGSFFSRYAASSTRSNNLTPLLTNTFSSGPFRYQHIFFTGTTPNGILIHNEAQSQIFYRLKAAYFHASVLIDPNLALVGKNYWWRSSDLEDEDLDDRLNEYAIVELGFDLGPVAVQLQPVSLAHAAIKQGNRAIVNRTVPLWRGGVRVVFPELTIEAMGGLSPSNRSDHETKERFPGDEAEPENADGPRWTASWDATWSYVYARLNITWLTPWHDITLRWWNVVRHFEHELTLLDRTPEIFELDYPPPDRYRSLVVSTALQATYTFWHRFEVGAHVVFEVQRRRLNQERAQVRLLPKFSLFAGMSF